MRFGIDLDGVLGDFGSRVVEIGNTLWPGKFPEGYIPDNWDYEGYLTPEEWKRIWVEIVNTPHFWLDEKPMPGIEDLQNHIDPQDEIYFVTARKATKGAPPLVQSAQWLSVYGLWSRDGYSTVLPVEHAEFKKDLFRGLNLKFMLDDYAPTIQQLNEIEGMHAFVLDQPWNRYAKELPRVYSVAEYMDTIRFISKYPAYADKFKVTAQ